MSEAESYQQVYNQAIKYLTIRQHTVGELQQKLLRKKFAKDLVNQVIRRLEELDFLNDERYARVFVENLKQYKDWGYYGVKAKFLQRKVPTETISRVLEDCFPVGEELNVARRYYAKLVLKGRKQYAQIARSLASKGFRGEVVSRVLKEVFPI